MGRGRRGNHRSPTAAAPTAMNSGNTTAAELGESNAPAASLEASLALPPPRKRQKREEYRHSITTDESRSAELPKKKWFRQRAHANPFSDHRLSYPIGPDQMDWSKHYPAFIAPLSLAESDLENNSKPETADEPEEMEMRMKKPRPLIKNVEIADIGCGYGGLLFGLGPKMPETLILGLEIRTAITEFVDSKIRALRHQSTTAAAAVASKGTTPAIPPASTQHQQQEERNTQTRPNPTPPAIPAPGHYQNIATHRTNSMKFLPNFFPRASLAAIFLCFPDPHFKSRKHKARIVSASLNAEYAFVLAPGGRVYTVTDVEELGEWIRERFDAHKAFERVLVGVEEVGGGGGRVWKGDWWDGEGGERVESQDGLVDGTAGRDKAERERERAEVDGMVKLMLESTEEGKKVEKFGGNKFVGVWRRIRDPPWPGEEEV